MRSVIDVPESSVTNKERQKMIPSALRKPKELSEPSHILLT